MIATNTYLKISAIVLPKNLKNMIITITVGMLAAISEIIEPGFPIYFVNVSMIVIRSICISMPFPSLQLLFLL